MKTGGKTRVSSILVSTWKCRATNHSASSWAIPVLYHLVARLDRVAGFSPRKTSTRNCTSSFWPHDVPITPRTAWLDSHQQEAQPQRQVFHLSTFSQSNFLANIQAQVQRGMNGMESVWSRCLAFPLLDEGDNIAVKQVRAGWSRGGGSFWSSWITMGNG